MNIICSNKYERILQQNYVCDQTVPSILLIQGIFYRRIFLLQISYIPILLDFYYFIGLLHLHNKARN